MKSLLLLGGGGHCKAVLDMLEGHPEWRIVGIIEQRGSPLRSVLGFPVIGYDDDLIRMRAHADHALVCVGQIKSANTRARLFEQAVSAGFTLPAVVASSAHVARSARLGAGTVVMRGAHVGPSADVGPNCIVNTRALIEHDAIVGAHCHIATSAVLNGSVIVGDRCLIGSGAICREGVSIGANSIVGMGVRVLKPVTDATIYIGS